MLTAYLGIQPVYTFHEEAETWVFRRYVAGTASAAGAERTRPPLFFSQPIKLFRDRSKPAGVQTQQGVPGQRALERHTIYTRTQLLGTDDMKTTPQAADLLMNPADGHVWQVVATANWDEAHGYEVTIEMCGSVDTPPWT